MSFYAVAHGHIPGIYTDWITCKKQINNYSNALYKKFNNLGDAEIYYKNNKMLSENDKKREKPHTINSLFKVENTVNNKSLFNKFFITTPNEIQNKPSEKLLNISEKSEIIKPPDNILKETLSNICTKSVISDKHILFANSFNNAALNDSTSIAVYTDGSCINNGKKNARAGIGIYFGENDARNTSKEILTGKKTNNTAELTAIIEVFKILSDFINQGVKINIYSDSEYSIKCCKSFGKKQYMDNWCNNIPNIELIKEIYNLFQKNKNVEIIHIRAHTGKTDKHSIGNENADRLANLAIGSNINKSSKIYLNVLFKDKDIAKKMGSKWDVKKKKWYIMDDYIHKETVLSKFQS